MITDYSIKDSAHGHDFTRMHVYTAYPSYVFSYQRAFPAWEGKPDGPACQQLVIPFDCSIPAHVDVRGQTTVIFLPIDEYDGTNHTTDAVQAVVYPYWESPLCAEPCVVLTRDLPIPGLPAPAMLVHIMIILRWEMGE